MTARSSRFMRIGTARPWAPPREAAQVGRRGEDERRQGEHDEQDEEDDRELPEAALDAAPAAVDGRVAAERAGQPGAAGLEQDRGHEGDADDDLADGQERVHPGTTSVWKRRG